MVKLGFTGVYIFFLIFALKIREMSQVLFESYYFNSCQNRSILHRYFCVLTKGQSCLMGVKLHAISLLPKSGMSNL